MENRLTPYYSRSRTGLPLMVLGTNKHRSARRLRIYEAMDDRSYSELRKLKQARALELGNTRKIKTQLGRTSTAVEKHLAIYSAAEETMKQTGKIPVDALNEVPA